MAWKLLNNTLTPSYGNIKSRLSMHAKKKLKNNLRSFKLRNTTTTCKMMHEHDTSVITHKKRWEIVIGQEIVHEEGCLKKSEDKYYSKSHKLKQMRKTLLSFINNNFLSFINNFLLCGQFVINVDSASMVKMKKILTIFVDSFVKADGHIGIWPYLTIQIASSMMRQQNECSWQRS